MIDMWNFLLIVLLVSESMCSVIIVQDANCNDPCFRRLLSGKRIADGYVRRAMECDRLHDCHRMCEYERGFTCEGFNYRSHPKGICELTSIPPNRMDVNRDFISDSRYDFYERVWNRNKCLPTKYKYRQPSLSTSPQLPSWWSSERRPGWQNPERPRNPYDLPSPSAALPSSQSSGIMPYGGNFMENTRIGFGLPRPIDSNSRRPIASVTPAYNRINPWHSTTGSDQDSRLPLPVQPLEENYSPPQRPVDRSRRPDDYNHNNDGFSSEHGFARHPVYLPSRAESDDRIVYSGNGYSYGHKWPPTSKPTSYIPKYPQRRIGYGPDPATNEVAPHFSADQRKPSKPSICNSCRPSHADNYHHHHNDEQKYHRPPLDTTASTYPRIPNEHNHDYGSFHNERNSYGFSDRTLPPPRVQPLPTDHRECSVRSAGGFRLARGIIRKSHLTTSLEQCEKLCQNQKEIPCLTFAYRYNLAASSPTDNCLLSDALFENLIFYTDLEPDRDYDIYAMMEDVKWCENRTRPPSNSRHQRPPDECFWRIRSGFTMPSSVVKKPVRVEGMGECQVECVSSRDFTCRSFVFKYESYSADGLPNCFISDWPAMEIDPHKMEDMDGAELYERGSFGRGCEPYHPISHPDSNPPNRFSFHKKTPRLDEASCYTGYDRPCKLTSFAIILTTEVDSEADCRRKCSNMRQGDSTPCMSFSYKTDDNRQGDNCYLSDIPTRDLRPGLDYTHDEDYVLYVWKELEPRCSLIDAAYNQREELPAGYIPPNQDIEPKPYAKPDDPYFYDVSVPDPNRPAEGHTSLEHTYSSPGYDERFFYNVPNELGLSSRYTVDGMPCKRGTKCERNQIAGFWTCEAEGAEPGSWSYCCEPSHQCGFSQGFKYPWCFVGTSLDQWRPCSETYYPNIGKPLSHRPAIPRGEDKDAEHYFRHWPVAFLHGQSPPNGTDSVALANDIEHQTTNKSSETKYDIKPVIEIKNSTNTTTHLQRRGTRPRNDEFTFVPETMTVVALKTNESNKRSGNQRNTTKLQQSNTLKSKNVSGRFLRDQSNGQYYITKRLNAGFPTSENVERPQASKATVAKIERITKSDLNGKDDESSGNGQRLVTVALSKGPRPTAENNVKIIIPPISFAMSNASTVSSNGYIGRQWHKVETIQASHD